MLAEYDELMVDQIEEMEGLLAAQNQDIEGLMVAHNRDKEDMEIRFEKLTGREIVPVGQRKEKKVREGRSSEILPQESLDSLLEKLNKRLKAEPERRIRVTRGRGKSGSTKLHKYWEAEKGRRP